jgi:hypothetical protein
MASLKDRKQYGNLISTTGSNALLLEVLPPIGKAIQEEVASIGICAATSLEQDENPLVDMACETIEDFLGLSFVTCQVFITSVVSAHVKIAKLEKDKFLISKEGLLTQCSAKLKNADCTQIAAIDALANYFKHDDAWSSKEWPSDKKSKKTAQIIKALGGHPNSARNLRRGFEAVVGDNQYSRVERLAQCVETWAEKLWQDQQNKRQVSP